MSPALLSAKPLLIFICIHHLAVAPMAVDVESFKRAVSRFATGVSVIATAAGSRKAGMTANAVLSLSIDPPSLLFSMQRDAESTHLLHETRRGVISFLSADQRDVSERFAMHDGSVDKFAGTAFHLSAAGQPVIDGSVSAIGFEVKEIMGAWDHDIMICVVTGIEHCTDKTPLLYWGSGYSSTEPDGLLKLPRPR